MVVFSIFNAFFDPYGWFSQFKYKKKVDNIIKNDGNYYHYLFKLI